MVRQHAKDSNTCRTITLTKLFPCSMVKLRLDVLAIKTFWVGEVGSGVEISVASLSNKSQRDVMMFRGTVLESVGGQTVCFGIACREQVMVGVFVEMRWNPLDLYGYASGL